MRPIKSKEIKVTLETMTPAQLSRLDAISNMLMAVLLCVAELQLPDKNKKD